MSHPFLRAARATKHLPALRGLSTLLRIYWRFATDEKLRIPDFDDDLKLDVSVRETIGINLWHAPKLFEKEERKAFCSVIKPGSVVLDVGANIGVYTLLAAKRGARVFAVEADPANAEMLRHHVEINGFAQRVTIFQMAASDAARTFPLFRNPQNSGGSNLYTGKESGQVEGRTVDSLGLPAIDVCKIDIEGSELMALHGMSETLARSPHLHLLVECSRGHGDPAKLLQLLRDNFTSIRVIGSDSQEIPDFCNLWASR